MHKSKYLLAILIFLLSSSVYAQNNTGTVKGFVYDKKTGEPLIYINVLVVGKSAGAQTDQNGYFSINLPPGTYSLLTTTMGYDSVFTTINLTQNSIVTEKIMLEEKEKQLKEVEVKSSKTAKTTHINMGLTTVTPREMKLLPSAGGEPDLAQYLQVIPGVVFTGDQGGQLYIRGGSPAQTGIYLDGVTIYNPFHSIGLFSVFETEAIRNFDVYSACFNAMYGNRTSAVVDVHYKDGNKNELSGIVSVSPIMSRVMLEGPIVKSKKHSGSGISFLVTGKSSYLDQTSKSLYGPLNETFNHGLPYSFTDLYGKVTFSGDNGSKLNIFAFNFSDNANLLNDTSYQPIFNYKWQNSGFGANFVVSPSSSTALIDGKFAAYNYNISLGDVSVPGDTIPRNSQIKGFESAINFSYFLRNYSMVKYGIEVSGVSTALNYYTVPGVTTTENRQSTMAALYLLYRYVNNEKFIIEPSFRLQYYSELNKLSPEPRIRVKYNITPSIRLTGGAGVYSQNIVSTKSDQDIVNLFTGFLLSPDQQITDANGHAVKSNLQTAYHLLGGLEIDIKEVELDIEPWTKYFGQIDELNRNKLISTQPDFVAASGLAYGTDMSAKYSVNRYYFWLAAGYQVVNYTSTGPDGNAQTYPAPFDTRFNGNALIAYTAGKHKQWDFSTRYSIHSPFPFTQTQGFYENLNLTQNGLATNPLQQNGNLGILYSNSINGGRLSWYQRMDISVKREFKLNHKVHLDATFAITNLLNRDNIFYVDRITNVRVYQLPFFPSANLTLHF